MPALPEPVVYYASNYFSVMEKVPKYLDSLLTLLVKVVIPPWMDYEKMTPWTQTGERPPTPPRVFHIFVVVLSLYVNFVT